MNKKAIAILGAIFLLIVGSLGYLLYMKYGSGSTSNPPAVGADTATTTASGATPSGDGNQAGQSSTKFVQLISVPLISPVLFFNGQGITYANAQGQLFKAILNSSSSPLSLSRTVMIDIPAKANISKIIWPNRNTAGEVTNNFIAVIGSGTAARFSVFDATTTTFTDLPAQVQTVDFLPGGDKLIYVWKGNGTSTLNIADPNLKNWGKISDIWGSGHHIQVSPNGLNILFYQQDSTADTNAIGLTTPDGKVWKSLVKDGYNLGALWSPDSQKFLFGKKEKSTGKYQLWYYDLVSGQESNLGLFTTPDKAVWSADGKAVFAAVPTSGAAEGSTPTADTFYRIEIATLNKNEYNPGPIVVDGRDLFLSLDGTKLFFRDAQSGTLYYLDLNQ